MAGLSAYPPLEIDSVVQFVECLPWGTAVLHQVCDTNDRYGPKVIFVRNYIHNIRAVIIAQVSRVEKMLVR